MTQPAETWRMEAIFVALFVACWLVVLLSWLGLVPLTGNLPLSLYSLYSVAAALGWGAANVCVVRRRRFPEPYQKPLTLIYYLGPQGLVYLLRSMAPAVDQRAAPFVPVYAFGVFTIFFWVLIKIRKW